MNTIPKWVWIALAVGVVIILALYAKGQVAAVAPSVDTSALNPTSDPNAAATDQAAITARTSAFSSLADGVFGLQGQIVTGARDTNIAALASNDSTVQSVISGNVAENQAAIDYQTVLAQEAGATQRSGIDANAAFGIASTEAVASTQAATIQAGVQNNQTQAAQTTAQYLADQATAANADNNRTALAINAQNAAVANQAELTKIATSSSSSGIWGLVGAIAGPILGALL